MKTLLTLAAALAIVLFAGCTKTIHEAHAPAPVAPAHA